MVYPASYFLCDTNRILNINHLIIIKIRTLLFIFVLWFLLSFLSYCIYYLLWIIFNYSYFINLLFMRILIQGLSVIFYLWICIIGSSFIIIFSITYQYFLIIYKFISDIYYITLSLLNWMLMIYYISRIQIISSDSPRIPIQIHIHISIHIPIFHLPLQPYLISQSPSCLQDLYGMLYRYLYDVVTVKNVRLVFISESRFLLH